MFESILSLAQVLGYVALLISLLGYQVRSQRGLFAANIGSDVFWGLHYAALGGFMPVWRWLFPPFAPHWRYSSCRTGKWQSP